MPVAETTSPSGVTARIPGCLSTRSQPRDQPSTTITSPSNSAASSPSASGPRRDTRVSTPQRAAISSASVPLGAPAADTSGTPPRPPAFNSVAMSRTDERPAAASACLQTPRAASTAAANSSGTASRSTTEPSTPGADAARVLASGSPSPASADSIASRRAPARSRSMVADLARSAASSHLAWDPDRVSDADSYADWAEPSSASADSI